MSARTRRLAAAGLAACALALLAGVPALAAPRPDTLTAASRARLLRASGPLPARGAVAVTFTGTLDDEGHFARPHEVRHYRSERRIVVGASGDAREDWTLWSDADTARAPITTLLAGDRVLRRDAPDSAWHELAGREAGQAVFAIVTAAPPLAVARGLAANGNGLEGGPRGATLSLYSWPERIGTLRLSLDPLDLPADWSTFLPDSRRGSLSQSVRIYECSREGDRIWPDSLRSEGLPEDAAWVLRERRTGAEEPVSPELLAVPADVRPAPAAPDTVARVVPVAKGVWAVELPDANTRSLAVEFAHDLVLLETSSNGFRGERIRAALAAKFPAKPVRFVAFSHYHPDYIGGLRPFLADSARVVCSPSLADYVREIARENFTLNPDRLWKLQPGGVPVRFDTLRAGRWSRADGANELVALDIGPRSGHTDSYVVFWLPRQKLLFEGDLGYYSAGGSVRASRRAPGLVAAIDEAKLAPVTVVQSWPLSGAPASLPWATLRALAAPPPAGR